MDIVCLLLVIFITFFTPDYKIVVKITDPQKMHLNLVRTNVYIIEKIQTNF